MSPSHSLYEPKQKMTVLGTGMPCTKILLLPFVILIFPKLLKARRAGHWISSTLPPNKLSFLFQSDTVFFWHALGEYNSGIKIWYTITHSATNGTVLVYNPSWSHINYEEEEEEEKKQTGNQICFLLKWSHLCLEAFLNNDYWCHQGVHCKDSFLPPSNREGSRRNPGTGLCGFSLGTAHITATSLHFWILACGYADCKGCWEMQ